MSQHTSGAKQQYSHQAEEIEVEEEEEEAEVEEEDENMLLDVD